MSANGRESKETTVKKKKKEKERQCIHAVHFSSAVQKSVVMLFAWKAKGVEVIIKESRPLREKPCACLSYAVM